tara:strand:+ start:8578 stop:9237 length:660 start_codon:yes stop_codon:yes gene_type:complete
MFAVKNKSNETLVFYDVPKNASTTIKKLFIDHLNLSDEYSFFGEEYIDQETGQRVDNSDKSKDYKQNKENKKDFHDFAQNTSFQQFSVEGPCYRICVVRQPLDRFISCYNHLVLVNKEMDFTPHEILDHVVSGKQRSNHFLPQTVFLGENKRYYDKIYNVKQLDILEKELNSFFGNKKPIEKYQTSGSSVEFPISLDKDFIDKVHEVYDSDYKAYGEFF